MIKICFFTGDITRAGGTERVSTVIANGLAQTSKYEIHILSIVEQNSSPHFPLSATVERHTLKKEGNWISFWPKYLTLLPALRRFLKQQHIDIIIDVDLVLDMLSLPVSVGLPVKVISWEHFHYYFERKKLYRWFASALAAAFSDYIITLTPQDKRNYQEKLHRRNNIDYIYNPIAEPYNINIQSNVSPQQKEKNLITIGRLAYVKRIDVLAEIVPRILCNYPDWKWYFVGEGKKRKILEDVRAQYSLEDRLILTGVISNVKDYLDHTSICVHAPLMEPFGMCLLEARACGVPCVSFDVPYGPAIIIDDKVNGFLVPPFDIEEMVDKIILLMENSDLRNKFSKNALQGMEKFQLYPIQQKWEQLLDKLVDTSCNK